MIVKNRQIDILENGTNKNIISQNSSNNNENKPENDIINLKNNEGKTPLHIACQNNNKDIIRLLLKYGANIDEQDIDLNTPLHIACQNNQHDIVNILLENKANINAKNKESWTPLHIVCKQGNTLIAEELLRNEANIRLKTKSYETALHIACKKGQNEIVKDLLKEIRSKYSQYREINDDIDECIEGKTLLYIAC